MLGGAGALRIHVGGRQLCRNSMCLRLCQSSPIEVWFFILYITGMVRSSQRRCGFQACIPLDMSCMKYEVGAWRLLVMLVFYLWRNDVL